MATTIPTADELRQLTAATSKVVADRRVHGVEHSLVVLRIGLAVAGHLDRIATALEEEAAIADAALERRPAGPYAELRDRLAGAIHQARAKRGETVTLAVEDAVALVVALGRTAR